MKLTLVESKYLKEGISIISELVNDVNLRVTSTGLELIAMDPANVAMVIYKLLSSAFVVYELEKDTVLGINLDHFRQVLRRVKPTDSLTLELDEEKNRLNVLLQGDTFRRFSLSLIDIDDSEQKIPNLSFVVRGEGNLSQGRIEIKSDNETDIVNSIDGDIRAKYSIEYLKKIIRGSKLSGAVSLQFAQDYPLKVEYRVVDKMSMTFILAPRVDRD